jgi:hypothetical protein
LVLFGSFNNSLYSKLYITVVQFLSAQGKLKKGAYDDLLFNMLVERS